MGLSLNFPVPERITYGTLTAEAGTPVLVYTVPRQTRIVLNSVLLTNMGTADVTVGLAITVGALTEPAPLVIPCMPPELVLGPGDSYHLTTPIAVEANELIYMSSSSPNAISFYITATKTGAIPSPSPRGT